MTDSGYYSEIDDQEYDVERILAMRINQETFNREYLIR